MREITQHSGVFTPIYAVRQKITSAAQRNDQIEAAQREQAPILAVVVDEINALKEASTVPRFAPSP
jgi:hypothetical protein